MPIESSAGSLLICHTNSYCLLIQKNVSIILSFEYKQKDHSNRFFHRMFMTNLVLAQVSFLGMHTHTYAHMQIS